MTELSTNSGLLKSSFYLKVQSLIALKRLFKRRKNDGKENDVFSPYFHIILHF